MDRFKQNTSLPQNFIFDLQRFEEPDVNTYPIKVVKESGNFGDKSTENTDYVKVDGDENTRYYATMSKAMTDLLGTTATVSLRKSVTDTAFKVGEENNTSNNTNITLNLCGNTYSFKNPAVGSNKDKCITVLQGKNDKEGSGTGKTTFTVNGGDGTDTATGTFTIAANEAGFGRFLRSYADVTLNNVTIDGTGLGAKNDGGAKGAVIAHSYGNLSLTGSTTINLPTATTYGLSQNNGGNSGFTYNTSNITVDTTTGNVGDIALISWNDGSDPVWTKSTLTVKQGNIGKVTVDATAKAAISKNPAILSLPKGYEVSTSSSEGDTYTLAYLTSEPTDAQEKAVFVIKVTNGSDTRYYKDMQLAMDWIHGNAVDSAENGATVTLLADLTIKGFKIGGLLTDTVGNGKYKDTVVTIDLNGHNITFNDKLTASSSVTPKGIQIVAKDGKSKTAVTIKNSQTEGGTLQAANGTALQRLIRSYANLTLDKVKLDGSNLAQDAGDDAGIVAHTMGTLTVTNGTSFITNNSNTTPPITGILAGTGLPYSSGFTINIASDAGTIGDVKLTQWRESGDKQPKNFTNAHLNINSTTAVTNVTLGTDLDSKAPADAIKILGTVTSIDENERTKLKLTTKVYEAPATGTDPVLYYMTEGGAKAKALDSENYGSIKAVASNKTLGEAETIYYAKSLESDIQGKYQATVTTTGEPASVVYYEKLSDALTNATANSTVTLLADLTATDAISISNTNAFTFSTGKKTLTLTKSLNVDSGASVTLTGTFAPSTAAAATETTPAVAAFSGDALISNAGTLTLSDATLSVPAAEEGKTAPYVVSNTGKLTVNNDSGTIKGNVLLKGEEAVLTLTKGEITGDLLVDANAAKNLTEKVKATEGSFTGGTQTVDKDNIAKLVAYSADESSKVYGLTTAGWSSAPAGDVTTWSYITKNETSGLGEVVFAISGLASTVTADTLKEITPTKGEGNVYGLEITSTNAATLFGTLTEPATVTVTNGTLTLKDDIKATLVEANKWNETSDDKSTPAVTTYSYYTAAGSTEAEKYTLSDKDTTSNAYTLTYYATAAIPAVTVSGLDAGLVKDDKLSAPQPVEGEEGKYTLEITQNMLPTKVVSTDNGEATLTVTGATLKLAEGLEATAIAKDWTAPADDATDKTTYSYSSAASYDKEGYTLDSNKITHVKPAADVKSFKVTGLKEGLTAASFTANTVNVDTTGATPAVVIKSKDLLPTASGTLSISGGTLTLDDTIKATVYEKNKWHDVKDAATKTYAYYNSDGNTTGYTLSGTTLTYYKDEVGPAFTMAGEGLTAEPDSTVFKVNGNTKEITIDDVTKIGDKDLTLTNATFEITDTKTPQATTIAEKSWVVDSSDTTKYNYYEKAGSTAGYTIDSDKKKLSYSASGVTSKVSVTGLNGAPTNFAVSDTMVTVDDATIQNLTGNLTTSGTFSVEGTKLTKSTEIKEAGWGSATQTDDKGAASYYATKGDTAGYKLTNSSKTLSYITDSKAVQPAFTISGLKPSTALSGNVKVDGTSIEIGSNALPTTEAGTSISLTTSGSYTLKLGTGITEAKTGDSNPSLEKSGSNYTYSPAKVSTAGYALSEDKKTITYQPKGEDGEQVSITLSGLKVSSDLAADAKKITLDTTNKTVILDSSLVPTDGTAVTLSTSDYKFAVGSLTKAVETSEDTLEGGVYKTKGVTTAGYKVTDTSITYANVDSVSLTFTGLADATKASDISISSKKEVTLKEAAIGTGSVTMTTEATGYKLALGSLKAPKEQETAKISGNVYTSAGVTTEGYKIDGNTITYKAADSATVEFTALGSDVKADMIEVKDKTVTIKDAKALGSARVKLTDAMETAGYTLAINSSLTQNKDYYQISVGGTKYYTANLTMKSLTDAKVNVNDIILTGGEEVIVLSAKEAAVTVGNKSYTAKNGELTNTTDKKVTLTANYEEKSYKVAESITAVDAAAVTTSAVTIDGSATKGVTIVGGASGNKITGGTGADKVTLGGGKDTYVLSGGKDTVAGFDATNDMLDLGDIKITDFTKGSKSGSNTTFTYKNGSVQLNDFTNETLAVDGATLTTDGYIDTGKVYNLFSDSGKGTYSTVEGMNISEINAKNISDKVTLDGGKDNIKLTGGTNTDTYIYGGGAVNISNFEKGEKITFAKDFKGSITGVTVSGNDVNLEFGDSGNTVTLGGAADNEVDVDGKAMYFPESGVIANKEKAKATSVTVLSGASNFNADDYAKVKNIEVETGASVTGNSNNNVIDATNATAAVTLNGGGGSNTLTGGKGADTFVHTGDNKKSNTTIKDYQSSGDTIDAVSISGVTSEADLLQKVEDVSLKQKSANGTLTVKLVDGSTIEITSTDYKKEEGKVAAVSITGAGNVSFGTDAIYHVDNNKKITGVNLMAGYSGKYDASSKLKGLDPAEKVTIDGAAVEENKKTKLHIIGTDSADSIIGGKAGKGNTLQGGGGDDTLTGTKGFKDTFYYSKNDAGVDVVANFDYLEDTIKIDKSLKISKVEVSGGNVTFTMDKGTFKVDTKSSDSKILFKSGNTLYWWEEGATPKGSKDATGAFVTASKNGNGKKDLTSILKAFKKDTDQGFCVVNLDANIKDLIDKTAAKDATFSKSSGGSYTPTSKS